MRLNLRAQILRLSEKNILLVLMPCGDALRAVLLKFLDFSNQESQAVARLRDFVSPAPLTLLVFGACRERTETED